MSLEEILEFFEKEGNTEIMLIYNEDINYEINDKSKRIRIVMQKGDLYKTLITSIDGLKNFDKERKAIFVDNLPPENEMYKNMGYYCLDLLG